MFRLFFDWLWPILPASLTGFQKLSKSCKVCRIDRNASGHRHWGDHWVVTSGRNVTTESWFRGHAFTLHCDPSTPADTAWHSLNQHQHIASGGGRYVCSGRSGGIYVHVSALVHGWGLSRMLLVPRPEQWQCCLSSFPLDLTPNQLKLSNKSKYHRKNYLQDRTQAAFWPLLPAESRCPRSQPRSPVKLASWR